MPLFCSTNHPKPPNTLINHYNLSSVPQNQAQSVIFENIWQSFIKWLFSNLIIQLPTCFCKVWRSWFFKIWSTLTHRASPLQWGHFHSTATRCQVCVFYHLHLLLDTVFFACWTVWNLCACTHRMGISMFQESGSLRWEMSEQDALY